MMALFVKLALNSFHLILKNNPIIAGNKNNALHPVNLSLVNLKNTNILFRLLHKISKNIDKYLYLGF